MLEDIRARTCFCGERPAELADLTFIESGVNTEHRACDMNYPMSDGHHLIVNGKIRSVILELFYTDLDLLLVR